MASLVININALTMNHHKPFDYDPTLLEKCAEELSSSNFLEKFCFWNETRTTNYPSPQQVFSTSIPCGILFQLHATHYRRPGFQDLSWLQEVSQQVDSTLDEADPSVRSSPQVTRRYCHFLQNVDFVYHHNVAAEAYGRHRVTLNRFSDLDPETILPDSGASRLPAWTSNTTSLRGHHHHHRQLSSMNNLQLGHGSVNKLNPKIHHPKKNGLPSRSVRIPGNDRLPFESPSVPRALNGYLVAVKKNKDYDTFFDNKRDAWQGPDSEGFKMYLNWATDENPDGVSLVHDAIDQGHCGSCWALAATGSLEASAARKAAFDAYQGYLTTHIMSSQRDPETLRQKAIATAQKVEKRAMKALNLSIQELIDCDTTTDQGCTGGNPLLSFHFIHRYGLVAWDDYPYVGHENQCNTNSSKVPLATAQSWGIVQANYEKHMELAVRYIGPISVGLNGASKSFLAYSGGIFDEPECDQSPNHALLIVGYGEDVVGGVKVRYWIARNSWGTGWGENGFVRIKRGSGKRGVSGVCGIARNPSVALAGYLLREETNMLVAEGLDAFPRYSLDDPVFVFCSKRGLTSRSYCLHVGGWVYDNRAWILGFLGFIVLLLTLWPLTLDIRRRRQRRLKRRELQKKTDEHQSRTETTPLLEDVTNPHGYNVRIEEN